MDVVFDRPHGRRHVVAGLKLQRVDNFVDRTSRSVGLYIRLPNSLRSDRQRAEARYVDWIAMPGERVQIRLPCGKPLRKQIVLPVEAVTQPGSRHVVFRQHDGHFDRVPVRLRHRDAHLVVVDRDGALSRGNLIAVREFIACPWRCSIRPLRTFPYTATVILTHIESVWIRIREVFEMRPATSTRPDHRRYAVSRRARLLSTACWL